MVSHCHSITFAYNARICTISPIDAPLPLFSGHMMYVFVLQFVIYSLESYITLSA